MSVRSRRRKQRPSSVVEMANTVKLELHEKLDEQHLDKIKDAFFIAAVGEMNENALRSLLFDVAKLTFEDTEFEVLFKKMNTARNGLVTWDEFISHLILGFKEKEVLSQFEALEPPISTLPRMLRSYHRHPISCITFCATVKADRTASYSEGNYMTCSKDGVINYWSLDMVYERTVVSSCPELKVQTTWVTDLVCLSDVSVVCTSSTERDLRFYDTSAQKFELRVMISSLENAVCAMYYFFSEDISEDSKLILGDMGGNVKVIFFPPLCRGPFRSKPGIPLLHVRYEKVLKGLVPGFRVSEFKEVHTDWVRQVSFYPTLNSIVSCAVCPKTALSIRDSTDTKDSYVFKILKGAWCFALTEAAHLIATGGPDCIVRVWNPFVPTRPSAILVGHHSGILAIVLQDGGKKLCSLSKDKCIKVWDVSAQICIQTYLNLPPELGEHVSMCLLYNPDTRQLLIGSVMIAILPLCPRQSADHTDGTTHSLAVSMVLYNPLFKIVLTCGLDSYIIVWDPWLGRRMSVVKDAHTRLLYGEIIPVEITAATFDPGNQLLLTGASDGSLKMWNFNTGTCLRNMQIEEGCEISTIVWIKGRILAIGWNKHITEFDDSGGAAGPGGAFSKSWDTRHTEDVLCAAARVPQSLATSTYNGELILWQLETGQPYKRYNVANPTGRIKIEFKKDSRPSSRPTSEASSSRKSTTTRTRAQSRVSRASRFRKQSRLSKTPTVPSAHSHPTLAGVTAARIRRISMVTVPETCVPLRGESVRSMIFLSARPNIPGMGTLLVGLENGTVQIWSHHPGGGFICAFQAIHTAADSVLAMATDAENEFLFTGTSAGYIKTWLMKSFAVLEEEYICMPKYRLIFPFLWKSLIEGRAKRAARGQPKPVLLSSYKAHLMPVSGITYIDKSKIVISCSADHSVRLWSLSGRYLGTLGTFKPWVCLHPDAPPGRKHKYQFPADLKRCASSTTFKVFMGETYERKVPRKQEEGKIEKHDSKMEINTAVYGKKIGDPILGNHFRLPERTTRRHEFQLDTSFAYIPVYQHLILPPPLEFVRPSTPPKILLLREKTEIKKSA